jgi:hypothetical protein
MPVYETRTSGGSSMNMLGIFLICCVIIAVAVIVILHGALHVF